MFHSDQPDREFLHALSQPLNVIRLTADNLEHYVQTHLTGPHADYLGSKLDRIRQQLVRAADLLEAARSAAQGGDPAAGGEG